MSTSAAFAQTGDLRQLLSSAVIQVGQLGTAFLIDKDAALTCAHLFTAPDKWTPPPETTALQWGAISGSATVRCLRTKETPSLPDLALLEDIRWDSSETLPLTCVMLEDLWTEGRHYFSYGHPEGRFPVQALALEYEGSYALDAAGRRYLNLTGRFIARPGFSGSPILNTRTGKVCGVLAISMNANVPEGVRAVPISYALEHFPQLADRQKHYHKSVTRWGDLLPGALAWRMAESKCRDMEQMAQQQWPACKESHYQPRAIEGAVKEFLRSPARGMFIVGDSGMGKSTLLARLISEYREQGHLCAFIKSEEIPPSGIQPSGIQVETYLTDRMGRQSVAEPAREKEFWAALDAEGERREHRFLLVFIDAINEFNKSGDDPAPIRLLEQLDELIRALDAKHDCVKFIITCRPETWRKATDSGRFEGASGIYFTPSEKQIAWILPRFSPEEFQGAYDKYRLAGNIQTPFDELSDLAKYHLRDPFLLNLAQSAFAGQGIPRDLDTGDLFARYFETLKEFHSVLDDIVSEMFEGDPSGLVIKRISFARDSDLQGRRPHLHTDLDLRDRRSAGWELRDRKVIRDWKLRISGNHYETQIRFSYDRFAEYLLSNRLNKKIRERSLPGQPLPVLARQVVENNLFLSQRTPIIYGALQRMLFLLGPGGKTYVEILRAISEIDARGQWLVISVLARTARNASGGIEMLADLLKQLGRRRSRDARKFPLIDSVYRVMRDEDYRLWLDEQSGELRDTHLVVLRGHFVQAFRNRDRSVSSSAIQYLFFLWSSSSEHAFKDAQEITASMVEGIESPLLTALSGHRRRAFVNLAALMVLVLSEAPKERFARAAKISGEAVGKLKLKKFQFFINIFIRSVLLNFILAMLRQLPNPVQYAALEYHFGNRDLELPIFEDIIELLDPSCNRSKMTVANLKRLARTGSGFAIQMLTFAISVNYERAKTAEARTQALELARDVFFGEPRTVLAEYCSSLALYHINDFGSFATEDSMRLMEQMAESILKEHHGEFLMSGKKQTFNIIGTFGRSLHKNGFAAEQGGKRLAMQYALNALELAKNEKNAEFYQYVCSELGLLGVLVEPKYLFDVFTAILKDIQDWEDGRRAALPFNAEQIEKSKETMLQSLANIRVLYRQQVDKYLLEGLENPELYGEVATKRNPDFRLSFFLSWAFEQLMFRCLVHYDQEIGSEFLQSFLDAARCKSPIECVRMISPGW